MSDEEARQMAARWLNCWGHTFNERGDRRCDACGCPEIYAVKYRMFIAPRVERQEGRQG